MGLWGQTGRLKLESASLFRQWKISRSITSPYKLHGELRIRQILVSMQRCMASNCMSICFSKVFIGIACFSLTQRQTLPVGLVVHATECLQSSHVISLHFNFKLCIWQLEALKSLATPKTVEPGKDNWVIWTAFCCSTNSVDCQMSLAQIRRGYSTLNNNENLKGNYQELMSWRWIIQLDSWMHNIFQSDAVKLLVAQVSTQEAFVAYMSLGWTIGICMICWECVTWWDA